MELKKDAASKLLVRLLDSNSAPVTSVAYTDVTAWAALYNETQVDISPTGAGAWVELGDGFAGTGTYWLAIPTAATAVAGQMGFIVSAAGAEDFISRAAVVDNLEGDTFAAVGDVASDVWDVARVSLTAPGSVGDAVRKLLATQLNRARIDKNAKTLIVYADDGTTPLLTFNLKDLDGNATETNPTERVP